MHVWDPLEDQMEIYLSLLKHLKYTLFLPLNPLLTGKFFVLDFDENLSMCLEQSY